MDSSKLSIRDLHLIRSKMWDSSMQNHSHYIDPETGKFADQFVESRSCPACQNSNEIAIFQKSGGQYVRCNDCQMVFLNPVFKQEYLKEYYGRNHDVQSEIVEMDSSFYKTIYQKGLDLLNTLITSPGNILDVGCSSGVFLDMAKAAGWKTFGLELNRKELAYSLSKGHAVQNETIDRARFDEKIDVISLWDVFEHIPNGIQFLKDAFPHLSDEGMVFIQSPQSASLAARILQEKCNMFDGLEHVNLYNRDNLAKMAQIAGYELIAFQTVIPELGVINNHLNYEDPYLGGTNNKSNLLGLINEQEVLDKGWGYKFQAILRKK
jgi:2-polyprenyl-3-methyl-5-hydroxy-6-metoxy-1,4-benzoquinol methylase